MKLGKIYNNMSNDNKQPDPKTEPVIPLDFPEDSISLDFPIKPVSKTKK